MDNLSPEQRSRVMRSIGSKDTAPEVALRRALVAAGLGGFRKYWGRPSVDVAWPGRKLAVFVDSCFWHVCPEHGKVPDIAFWQAKLRRNAERDVETTARYRAAGWSVVRLWTHLSVEEMVETVREAHHAMRPDVDVLREDMNAARRRMNAGGRRAEETGTRRDHDEYMGAVAVYYKAKDLWNYWRRKAAVEQCEGV